jgi:chaperone modulatory protein CbpM
MKVNATERGSLNEPVIYSAQNLAEVSGLSNEQLDDMIENGVIAPVDANARPMSFPPRYIVVARMARRLRDDFELDRHGVTLAMNLIQRIEELEMELNAVRSRLGHGMSNPR